MAQWAGMGSGRTRETRIADAEASLRRAVYALANSDAAHLQRKSKNVLALAEAVLSARVRHLKAVINVSSQQRPSNFPQRSEAELPAQRRRLEEMQRAGVNAVLEEFGVDPIAVQAHARQAHT